MKTTKKAMVKRLKSLRKKYGLGEFKKSRSTSKPKVQKTMRMRKMRKTPDSFDYFLPSVGATNLRNPLSNANPYE